MTTLGKYEVLGELAKGSMGVIYRARDPILDREVALKTISGSGSIDAEMKERFYREARAGARLHHPNVITVYELGEQDSLLFIALELLSGCDLRQFIRERRTLPAMRKLEVIAAVCDGLHHAHLAGIVHRDMKPSNVFLTDSGVPKILDFGVARLTTSKLTVVGRVLGTPFYMAPEQIMGQPCDARSDLFSLAIVAYEFLTYAHPFAGDTIPRRILNDAPDRLAGHNIELPPDLEPVLAQGLEKDPARRYQTAEAFGAAVRGVMREPAVSVPVWEAAAPAPPAPAPVSQPTEPAPPAIPKYANTETKMSTILTALQGFDQAIERREVRTARAALAIIEQLAQVDERFQTAARESRTRLNDLEASMPPEPPPAAAPEPARAPAPPPARRPSVYRAEPLIETHTPPPVLEPVRPPSPPPQARATPPPPAPPAEPPRAAAPPAPAPSAPAATTPVPSGLDDATSIFRVSDAPKPQRPILGPSQPPAAAAPPHRTPTPSPPPAPPPPRPTVARTPEPLPPRPAPPQPPGPQSNRVKLLIGGGAVAFLAVAAIAFVVLKPSNAALEEPVATAQVSAPQSAVLAAPDSSDVVVKLKKGDSVNVIQPRQEWTDVQYVAGSRVYPKGVMRTADLGNWNSPKPDVSLYLIKMHAPPDGAPESDLRQYAAGLQNFIQRFSATPQKDDAQAELDKTNAALARVAGAQSANAAVAEPPQKKQPPPLVKPPAGSPAVPPGLNVDAELARANREWENGQYAQAERILQRILQVKPDHAGAQEMLRKVQRARQLEGRQ